MADRRDVRQALGAPDVGPDAPPTHARVTLSLDRVTYDSLLSLLDGLRDHYYARGLTMQVRAVGRLAAALRGSQL
jgi:hypothetical protein